ncbi:cobalamin-independent methionine synthase II family protein [Nonomuraea jiangxiensis]|uniref:5-methyltetrahydropteroyltriglutamate--homocysteine methyltransferase n=1 Tax=Nonomuraea jiangxiensis TaxID=633440 RepID=A0A1G8T8M8_9ACTN|nr:cobalamin-independent methionine synthase II family protein [Nonomuraea jiangxiensis]SDJ37813.1 5-methyltetrahydropteroyltriglutamate--homocysteine methyltransferase [Nonomuraea jiangxiensis]
MPATHHAEHVGSLLRPPELLEARHACERGYMTGEELARLEDDAALAAIKLQREAGIEVFTDGEVRRATWMAGLLESLGGVVSVRLPEGGWFREDGAPRYEDTVWDMVATNAKLTQKRNLTFTEADFLARHAPGQFKITMMSSSMGNLLWRPDLSLAAYPTPADMVRDLVALRINEIKGLLERGVTWIQLDSLGYNHVIDPEFRMRLLGPDGPGPDGILDMTIAVDTEVVRAAKAMNPDVTVGMHICRGNNRSAWMSRGGYEPIAERLFGEVPVDRFLLEYDTDRAGGFEPLRFVPDGTTVVLGLVSSKTPHLESPDELSRRIDEAAKYVPLENLALSPQCGFASTARGNLLTIDDQRRKLELVANTARQVWGGA